MSNYLSTGRAAVLAAFVFLTATFLLAQTSNTGTISGRVVDLSGAAVAGAEVSVTNENDKTMRGIATGASGEFTFPQLLPGTYTVAVKMTGFKQFQKSGIQLSASDTLDTGALQLSVGAVDQTIEVKAEGAAVQTASGERSALIDSREISDLMARGRDVMAMLQILPGVVNDNTGSDVLGQFTTPTMDGMRNNYNSLTIDGISGNTARGSNAQSPINLDAISEVKVLQNSYPAEFGPSASGAIMIVTKSGAAQFHGGLYYYNRNEAFNANNYFNNLNGIARQRYRYNTVGEDFSGPIFIPRHFNVNRQKLFFFFSQEIDPNTVPNSISYFTMPTQLERQGDFSQSYKSAGSLYVVKDPSTGVQFPGNVVPPSRIDPVSSKLLSVFPLPNATNTATTKYAYNFQIAGTEDEPVLQEIMKVDYNISDRMRLWARASGFNSDNTGLTSPAIDNKWGLAPVDYKQTMPNIGVSFTYIVSPTLISEATFGMNLWTEQQVLTSAGLKAYQRSTYGINIPQSYPSDNPLSLLPAMSFGGISDAVSVNYDGRFPMVDDSTAYTLKDSVTKVWRSHLFKAGFQFQHNLYNQYHQAGGNGFPGNFSFGTDSNNPNDSGYAFANALLGNYDTYSEATNRVNYAPITTIVEWFVQDKWRLTSRLTLDLGVRFTDPTPMTPNNNNAANFIPYLYNPAQAPVLYEPALVNGKKITINPLTGATALPTYAGLIVPGSGNPLNGIVQPNTPGFPRAMVYNQGILPAPRAGFAWDPFGDGKTSVRGGAGIFYSNLLDVGTLGNLFFNPPAIYNPTEYYGTVATAANTTGLLSPSTFSRDIDPHARNVTAYQASFGIQRDMGWGTIVDVAYVGSFGRHLGENVQLNEVPYGAEFLPQHQNPQTGTPLNDNYFRPYLGYNGVPQQIFQGNSSYHSMQIQAHRRFARGLNFGASYTWSKAMDYAEGDSTTSQSGTNAVATYNNRVTYNYGLAGYNRPNIFTFYFLYDLPRITRLVPNKFLGAVFDGWQVSDITTFESGAPLGVTMNENPTVNFAGGGDPVRPLMVGNPLLSGGSQTFYNWFNVAAFAEPVPINPKSCTASGCPPVTFMNIGDAPETPLRGPGVSNFNTSLFKNITVRERLHFQFRAEAYNTFNHPQWSGVNTAITFNASGVNTNAQAGQITSARDPRIMQLALRLMF